MGKKVRARNFNSLSVSLTGSLGFVTVQILRGVFLEEGSGSVVCRSPFFVFWHIGFYKGERAC